MESQVKIFTATGCPYCKAAKDFLTEKGIPFEEIDVVSDRNAMADMQELTGGARTVPVLQICRDVIVGFDKDRVNMALNCLSQSTQLPDPS